MALHTSKKDWLRFCVRKAENKDVSQRIGFWGGGDENKNRPYTTFTEDVECDLSFYQSTTHLPIVLERWSRKKAGWKSSFSHLSVFLLNYQLISTTLMVIIQLPSTVCRITWLRKELNKGGEGNRCGSRGWDWRTGCASGSASHLSVPKQGQSSTCTRTSAAQSWMTILM